MATVANLAYLRDDFLDFSEANLSIASASVLYGLSVYSVFPVFLGSDGQPYMFRLEDHYKRLVNSSKILAFSDFERDWDYERFERTMKELIKQNDIHEDSLVRVALFVDDALKGTRMHGLKHSLSAFIYSTPPLLPKSGARVCVSSWLRTPDNAIPSRAKINGSYVNASLMKHEAVLNGFDDALALDQQGHLTEGTVANVFLVKDGQLITPDTSADLLEGITRDTVMQLAESQGLKVIARSVDRSEVYLADEIFFSGSSVRLTPIIEVDHRRVGNGQFGPVTEALSSAYYEAVRGQNDAFKHWLTVVE